MATPLQIGVSADLEGLLRVDFWGLFGWWFCGFFGVGFVAVSVVCGVWAIFPALCLFLVV